jgi:hypothetical protein
MSFVVPQKVAISFSWTLLHMLREASCLTAGKPCWLRRQTADWLATVGTRMTCPKQRRFPGKLVCCRHKYYFYVLHRRPKREADSTSASFEAWDHREPRLDILMIKCLGTFPCIPAGICHLWCQMEEHNTRQLFWFLPRNRRTGFACMYPYIIIVYTR